MSRWLNKAEKLAAKIRTLEAVVNAGLAVEVLSEEDLVGTLNTGIEKSAKGCIVVVWLGGRNPDPKSKTLRLGAGYSVSVWYPKRPGDRTEISTMAEAIAEGIHYWVDDSPGSLIHPFLVTSCEPVRHAGFQVIEIRGDLFRV